MSERRAKYNNCKVEIDGHVFASAAEGRRYSELKLMEQAGEISNLELQPRFKLVVNGIKICDYVADFTYQAHGRVVEDVKGYKTPVYRLKKKLMLACYGIEISEVTA